jgi:hypothetical protein
MQNDDAIPRESPRVVAGPPRSDEPPAEAVHAGAAAGAQGAGPVPSVPVGGARGLLARRGASGPLPSLDVPGSPVFPNASAESFRGTGFGRPGAAGRVARREAAPGAAVAHAQPLDVLSQGAVNLFEPLGSGTPPAPAARASNGAAFLGHLVAARPTSLDMAAADLLSPLSVPVPRVPAGGAEHGAGFPDPRRPASLSLDDAADALLVPLSTRVPPVPGAAARRASVPLSAGFGSAGGAGVPVDVAHSPPGGGRATVVAGAGGVPVSVPVLTLPGRSTDLDRLTQDLLAAADAVVVGDVPWPSLPVGEPGAPGSGRHFTDILNRARPQNPGANADRGTHPLPSAGSASPSRSATSRGAGSGGATSG